MLSQAQLGIIRNQYTPLPDQFPKLYHGTDDTRFYSKICLGHGFDSNQYFMANYSMKSLGQNVQYGPGIYLADTLNEAQDYGAYIMEFDVEPTTDYLDLTGNAGGNVARAVGVPKWHILAESQIYALIKVTAHYYVMRTPYNIIVSAH